MRGGGREEGGREVVQGLEEGLGLGGVGGWGCRVVAAGAVRCFFLFFWPEARPLRRPYIRGGQMSMAAKKEHVG